MKYGEWKNLFENRPEYVRPGDNPQFDYGEINGICAVKNLVPIPVYAISTSIIPPEQSELKDFTDIEVVDASGSVLGVLIPCKNRDVVDPQAPYMSDPRYAAYIADVALNTFMSGSSHRFKEHYFVVEPGKLAEYENNYKQTSAIWGNFYHEIAGNPILKPTHQFIPPQIVAVYGLRMPEQEHVTKSAWALVQPYAFERFLNQYHLLEMLFSYQIVEDIRAAQFTRDGIPILNKYLNDKNKEVDRLTNVLARRCKKPRAFELYFKQISIDPYYRQSAEKILIDGATSNSPFKDYYNKHILATGGKPIDDTELVLMTAKTIYQIRCSIAHSKLGEFFLTQDDEQFVVEIIEPLLNEVLKQAFGP